MPRKYDVAEVSQMSPRDAELHAGTDHQSVEAEAEKNDALDAPESAASHSSHMLSRCAAHAEKVQLRDKYRGVLQLLGMRRRLGPVHWSFRG